ncbi:uncharacterized protein LOC119398583 [Rhipicephalus sanguineus]|uniref:uncharacterized protein LOC119398583 n=1 Tax=Rhipicephalus sanguineus TaxID=34632 RepID=UPI0018957297|nr:uncharacterized protein LOC119398583 [Rhipicephalus sanguineus]
MGRGPTQDEVYPQIECATVEELDAPFTESEIRVVQHNLNSRSASGPDKLSNRLLRNLDDKAVELLTEEINRVWEEGEVPDEWKAASATAGMGLGVKFQAFVTSFLMNRTVTIQAEHIRSREYKLGPRGAPQGSVISPLLFNIVIKILADRLGGLRGIGHALYANDITIWCPGVP